MIALLAAAQFIEHPPLNFGPVAPELILVGAALLILLLDAFVPRVPHTAVAWIAFAAVVFAGEAALWTWSWHGPPTVLGGMVATDRYAVFFRVVLLAAAAIGIMLSSVYLRRSGEYRAEYYTLLLLATAGMTLLVAAADLILVFLALELLSLALYLLTGFSFRRIASAEASMKYFLLGAFSSAFFLYGVAFAYGASNTTSLAGLASAVKGNDALALIAVGLLLIGFAFKVAAVPFHMWTPDAYQGAPTCVTAFMSAGTKVAAFAALLRVLMEGFPGLESDWRPVVAVLAGITMVVGSILAIAQSDVKRMLAYSSIANAGFILVGVSAGTQAGVQAAMFYLAAYAALILGAFGVVILVSERGERRRRSPPIAAWPGGAPGWPPRWRSSCCRRPASRRRRGSWPRCWCSKRPCARGAGRWCSSPCSPRSPPRSSICAWWRSCTCGRRRTPHRSAPAGRAARPVGPGRPDPAARGGPQRPAEPPARRVGAARGGGPREGRVRGGPGRVLAPSPQPG